MVEGATPSNVLSASQLTPTIDSFVGGRVPLNGTVVGNVPPILPGLSDPRLAYLSQQQQYALALEQQVYT